VEDGPVETVTLLELTRDRIVYLDPEATLETIGTPVRLARDLKALYQLGSAIHASEGIEALGRHLLELLTEAVPASQAAVVLFEDALDEPAWALGWDRQSGFGAHVPVHAPSLRRVREEGIAILNNEDAGRGFVLAAPVSSQRSARGAIYLESRDPRVPFDEGHLHLTAAAGRIAGIAFAEALHYARLVDENRRLNQEIRIQHGIVGESPRISEVLKFVGKVARTDTTVLIYGETGTGKELVARAIHDSSGRADQPFVAVNCAALPETLLESELFGFKRGAFTNAHADKKGKFEAADGGTLFLDEIGEMAQMAQTKLLRVLQERCVERLGETRPIPIDVRVVAATNRDLAAAVADGSFRQDLYFRLNVLSVTVPPLRERKQDIPLLAAHFVDVYSKRVKRVVNGVSREAQAYLSNYRWPGNVRELQNVIEGAVVMGSTDMVLPEDLREVVLESAEPDRIQAGKYHESVRECKRRLLIDAIERAGGNLAEAARALGLNVTYLHRLIRNLDVPRPGESPGTR
jgi:Nif-specific regulatory protein